MHMMTVHMVSGKWEKFNIVVVLLFAGICTGCIHHEPELERDVAYYKEDSLRGDFTVTGEPILNHEVEIVLSVNPVMDAPNTSITLFLPEGIELVQGDLYWEGDIKKGDLVEILIMVKSIQEGQWEILAYVESVYSSRRKEHYPYYLYFLSAKDSGQVSRTRFYYERTYGKILEELIVDLALKSTPTPDVGEEVVLTFAVIASEDTPTVRVVIVLPEEFILIDGTLEWTGDLKEAQEETFQITIKTTERGRFEILGILTYDDEEWKFGYYIFVH